MRRTPLSLSIPSGPWDVVVIGAGAAGLMTCLELPAQLKVLLLNRNTSRHSSSRWAQGGLAAAIRPEDSVASHAEDTLKAGVGLCDGDSVRLLVKEAPYCVQRLEKLGMVFDREGKNLSTTLEAAHSQRRVLHVKDQTGRALVEILQDQVDQRPNLTHRRGVRVTQLWVEHKRCYGVQVLDGPNLHWIPARAVVLATGGGGHLFANTTNPSQASGEGISLAWRAGAAIEDLEFVQFHPTALKLKGAPSFLLSEALRGEGALLVDANGNNPVESLSSRELAPRHQVSMALVKAMREQRVPNLGLNLMTMPSGKLENQFPSILERLKGLGLDPFQNPIPIAPAAHYWMGGVATNLSAETTLPGLYAVGEVACTGLHGANRLASNSLMECLVFARQISSIELASATRFNGFQIREKSLPNYNRDESYFADDQLNNMIEDLRKLCWREAGVNRSTSGMKRALKLIKSDFERIACHPLLKVVFNQHRDIYHNLDDSSRRKLNLLLDLNHRQLTTSLMFEACLFRSESRGGHHRIDSPSSLPYWECHSRQVIGKEMSTRPVRR